MACSDKKNPLQRSGTTQAQRVLNGQKKGYVNIDERRIADWITFTSSFSRYIKYTGADGSKSDWSAFFNNDISAILGAVAIQDADAYRLNVKERFLILQDDANKDDTDLLKATFGSLFAILLTVSKALDDYIISLPEEIQLRTTIQNLIPARLRNSLDRLLKYYKAGLGLGLLTEDEIPGWTVFNYPVKSAATIISSGLSGIWIGTADPNWAAYYAGIDADPSVYGTSTTLYDQLNHAVNHNLFAGIFDQYLLAFARIVQDAEQQLVQTLEAHDDHKPHYALFLAFLKLFRTSQDSINELTSRHLDFYYNDVLQLTPRPAVADNVAIICNPEKNTIQAKVEQGRELNAGKDATGKDLVYKTLREIIVNQVTIGKKKTIYADRIADGALNALYIARCCHGKCIYAK